MKKRILTISAIAMAAGILGAVYLTGSNEESSGFLVAKAEAQSFKEPVNLDTAVPAEVFQHLRASKIYVNPPELARFGYSNGVLVNDWTRPLTMNPIVGTGVSRDLSGPLKSAIDQMDQAMQGINVTKEALLSLDIYYEAGGANFDKLVAISTVLNEYTSSRMAYETNPHRLNALPVRNIYGVLDVASHLKLTNVDNVKIALIPTVLDPATTTDQRLFNRDLPKARQDGEAAFIIGGLSSQSLDFSVPAERQTEVLLDNLDLVLRDMGATKNDVDTITILAANSCSIEPAQTMATVSDYFAEAGASPKIVMENVEVAGFAANCQCAEIEGTLAL